MNNIINIVALKLTWLAAVIGASKGMVLPSLVAVACFALWQLTQNRRHENDFLFICIAFVIGFILDSAWQAFGLIDYASGFSFIAPIWILCLWIAFAMTFNHSLSWLKTRPILAVLFGMIGAPVSYYAGHKLGALNYPNSITQASVFLGVSWGLIVLFFSQFEKMNFTKLAANDS